MMNLPVRYRTSRLLLIVGYLVLAYFLYFPGYVPSLNNTGFLGIINKVVIVTLILMSFRQFFYLFFSACEEVRRESLPKELGASEMHPISIIVPAHNEEIVIADTIYALQMLAYPKFEVIVVDDGSSDATFANAEKASGGDPRIRVLSKANGGKALALNHGIAHAKHDFVFCMDADSHLEANALQFGMRHFKDPEVVGVAGAVLILNRTNLLTNFQTVEYLTGLNFYKSAQSFLGMVTIVPGPAGLFRKADVEVCAGYEADTYAEDFDLTLKLLSSRGKIVYEPYMEVKTEVPEKIPALLQQRYRWNRGILQVLRKQFHRLRREDGVSFSLMLIAYISFEALVIPLVNVFVPVGALVYQLRFLDFSFWLFV